MKNKIWVIWILIIAVIGGWSLCEKKPQPIETSWGKVKSLISNGSVKKVEVINRETVLIYLTPEAIEKADTLPVSGAQFSFPIDNTDAFLSHNIGTYLLLGSALFFRRCPVDGICNRYLGMAYSYPCYRNSDLCFTI